MRSLYRRLAGLLCRFVFGRKYVGHVDGYVGISPSVGWFIGYPGAIIYVSADNDNDAAMALIGASRRRVLREYRFTTQEIRKLVVDE